MARIMRNALLSALGISVLITGELCADTITFTYNGNMTLNHGDTSTGSGSITFTPVAGAIGLAQVTAFSFTLNTDNGFIFNFGLADLTTFSLSSASPTATINLVTAFKPAGTAGPLPENFSWTGPLASSTGLVMAQQPPPAGTFSVDTGPVTITSYVAGAPILTKAFGAGTIAPMSSTTLTFTLRNPNPVVSLTGLAFSDTLPAGLVVSTPNGLSGSCPSGTITAAAGSTMIALSGAMLAAGASCTFSVNVTATGTVLGALTNTTSTVTSTNGAAGAAASATISVISGEAYLISYASNLDKGDSFVDITNTGANGASNSSGTTATIPGSLCANVYVFSPDEQILSCCSCPVTPNGLVSLSAQRDLISNTLIRTSATSIVIKLVATTPTGTPASCSNSAAAITPTSVASSGLAAWTTTLHAVAGGYGLTEDPDTPVTLSAGEISRLAYLCGFIVSEGSGFGVCNSCRLGGLGAATKLQ